MDREGGKGVKENLEHLISLTTWIGQCPYFRAMRAKSRGRKELKMDSGERKRKERKDRKERK